MLAPTTIIKYLQFSVNFGIIYRSSQDKLKGDSIKYKFCIIKNSNIYHEQIMNTCVSFDI